MEESIKELVRSLIYHGRHFSKTRDAVVEKKALERVLELASLYSCGCIHYKKELRDGRSTKTRGV